MYFVFVFVFCIICLLSMFAFVRQQHLKGFLFAQELTYKCTQLNLLTGSSKICKKKIVFLSHSQVGSTKSAYRASDTDTKLNKCC